MHNNKKYSKLDRALTNSFRRKMAGEIPARRCIKRTGRDRGIWPKCPNGCMLGKYTLVLVVLMNS